MVLSEIVCVGTSLALGEVLREVWVRGTHGRLSARQQPQISTLVRRCRLGQWLWDWYCQRGRGGVDTVTCYAYPCIGVMRGVASTRDPGGGSLVRECGPERHVLSFVCFFALLAFGFLTFGVLLKGCQVSFLLSPDDLLCVAAPWPTQPRSL